MLAFDEMTLVVNDLTAALEFYGTLLGFEVIGRDDRHNQEMAFLTLGKFRLTLVRPKNSKRLLPPQDSVTITFLADNFDALRQQLVGFVYHDPTSWTQGRSLSGRDPAGYTVKIVERQKQQGG